MDNETILESECKYCDGKGGYEIDGTDRYHICTMCNGSGYVTTEFGERVLALMRHNFRPLYEWMMENNPPASVVLFPLLAAGASILKLVPFTVLRYQ